MRKKTCAILLVLLLSVCACLCFAGCGKKYTVTFVSQYNQDFTRTRCSGCLFTSHATKHFDGIWETREVEKGGIIGNVAVDTKVAAQHGYKFCGWFTDESWTIQWNTLLDPVNGDITLYAKWEEI